MENIITIKICMNIKIINNLFDFLNCFMVFYVKVDDRHKKYLNEGH